MTEREAIKVLSERCDWLAARISAKKSIGWETTYDEREYAALCWAIGALVALYPESSIERETGTRGPGI